MWKPPKLEDLPRNPTFIGIDTETYDPDLKEGGPGWGRNWGHILGVSICFGPNQKYYLPIRHEVDSNLNLDKDKVIEYLSHILSLPIPKVGANLIYDIGWLMHLGVKCEGPYYDVQFAEALLEPNSRDFSLESLAQKYLKDSKVSDELYEWCAKKFGGKPNGNQRANIFRAPLSLVGPYAEADAQLPLEILGKQEPLLEAYGLTELFKMECDLIPILVKMRLRGVPVDLLKAQDAREDMLLAEEIMQSQLNQEASFEVNVNSGKNLAELFDKQGLKYPRTEKGNPSFTGSWLNSQTAPVARLINEIRKTKKARTSFIENAIIEKAIDNKIYPSLHPLRSDEGGTITGRFSSSKPNGQQIPSRDEHTAPIIRGIFVPEKGYTHWLKMDYAQIEYRMFAHYAEDPLLYQAYADDPYTDYHEFVQNSLLGGLLPRKPVKNVNFAILYAAGPDRVAAMLEDTLPKNEVAPLIQTLGGSGSSYISLAKKIFDLYDEKFPAARRLLYSMANKAKNEGEVRTILNRRTSFDLYAPIKSKGTPLSYNKAFYTYGPNIERAETYKALNYLLQGSAADLIKKGMLTAEQEGIFNKIGYPHLQVHDELNFSYTHDLKKHFLELINIMENAIPLKVPVLMDAEIGPDWGHCEESL